jgi:hypothetical protein
MSATEDHQIPDNTYLENRKSLFVHLIIELNLSNWSYVIALFTNLNISANKNGIATHFSAAPSEHGQSEGNHVEEHNVIN